MMASGTEELKALFALLTQSGETIVQSDSIPSLNDSSPHAPVPPSVAVLTALAAAKQLIATLEGPFYPLNAALSFHVPACLRVAVEAHAAETIAENEASTGAGLHVNEIAKSSVIDPKKLARVLRFLACQHFFRETAPDVFTNNAPSTLLKTGKTVKELMSSKNFFDGPQAGLVAVVCHCAEDLGKSAPYLADTLLSDWSHSYSSSECAWQKGYQTDKQFWAYIGARPLIVDRFASAMRFTDSDVGNITKGFDFRGLPDKAKVVDVGSGVGAVSKVLSKTHPHLTFVLQDRPEVINETAKAIWEAEEPEALSSGRVKLSAHDFFQPQPERNVDVFILRNILHDWPDKECQVILQHLFEAAVPTTKLVLLEQLVESLAPSQKTLNVPGAIEAVQPPYPLVHMSPEFQYKADLQMMAAFNAQERSVRAFAELGSKAGWKLEHIHPGPMNSQLVFSPVK